ncbi:MAG: long-chain acyl-CoA synthetase [Acidimicrobiaceae bacterium]|jgi:long-chain acyl-CoA synthetase|nr:long-chain acyl-CoA synthetase [Acidimicrobiaceae bacterium]
MNLASVIDGHPESATAVIGGDGRTTYGELRAQVAALRGGLARLGVNIDDRVAIVSNNDVSFVLTYLAVLGLGAVTVPLNPASPARELERELATVSPKVVVVGPGGAETFGEVDLAAAGGSVEHVINATQVAVPGAEPLRPLLEGDPAAVVERQADDLAVLIFTAGTSGSPRAAMLTHGNLLANVQQVQRHPGRAVGPDDVSLGVLPMFHIFGLNVMLGLALLAGASVVLSERFHASSALRDIAEHGVTMMAGPPTMYAALAALPEADRHALATVRFAASGAAPLSAEVAAAFESRFGIPLREGYGLTEASPVITSSVMDAPPKPGSIGVPIPGVEVRLVDDDGEDSLLGDAGELWARGPNIFPGYWHDEASTADSLTSDGWLRTGDIAVAGDDGELYLVDRAKDLIIVSGFNVFPAEVEEALRQHPAVAEVAVVGVTHAYTGETVHAYVVLADGAGASEAELIEHCARQLARYKCPTEVIVVPSLPHGLTGKLLRRALRQAPG